jgi:transglutaminase-like putative cysteine protease
MSKIKIANCGTQNIVNPTLTSGTMGLFRSVTDAAVRVTEGAKTDREKALLLYEYLRDFRNANYPVAGDAGSRTMLLLNGFGIGYCTNWAAALVDLFKGVGFPARTVGLPGHTVAEAEFDGQYRLFDVHYENLFLNPDNLTVASTEQVFDDPEHRT